MISRKKTKVESKLHTKKVQSCRRCRSPQGGILAEAQKGQDRGSLDNDNITEILIVSLLFKPKRKIAAMNLEKKYHYNQQFHELFADIYKPNIRTL